MCGRYTQHTGAKRYARLFGTEEPKGQLMARYNVAPSQTTWACAINRRDGQRHLEILRWGLVPHWSKGPDARYSMINARAETVATKPAYRDSFRRRRCLIPADGFYEWAQTNGKQPWYIHRADGEPMAFAGLWDYWKSPEGEGIASCAIIVTDANALMRTIHDRMPVILPPEAFEQWLNPGMQDVGELLGLLKPCPSEDLEAYPVSRAVNDPRHEGAELIEAVGRG